MDGPHRKADVRIAPIADLRAPMSAFGSLMIGFASKADMPALGGNDRF